MIVLDMPQRSPEWFKARRGVFTASDFGPFLVNTGKVAEAARQNFIDAKLGEAADGDDTAPSFEDYWMKRGTRLEPEALTAYSSKTGLGAQEVGLILHDNGFLGCSPDGLVDGGGLEMKCPCGKVQIKRLREAVVPPEYLYQIHGSMVITGRDWWDFWSYHPNLPPFYIRTFRDSLTRDLEAALMRLVADYKSQGAQLQRDRLSALS